MKRDNLKTCTQKKVIPHRKAKRNLPKERKLAAPPWWTIIYTELQPIVRGECIPKAARLKMCFFQDPRHVLAAVGADGPVMWVRSKLPWGGVSIRSPSMETFTRLYLIQWLTMAGLSSKENSWRALPRVSVCLNKIITTTWLTPTKVRKYCHWGGPP